MTNKIRILFVYRSFSSFVKNDLEILKNNFEVVHIKWHGKRDIIKIAYLVLKSDITFSWFALDHAAIAVFFSKIFRKKSIVIVGGVDVAYVPEINYGQFTFKWHKIILTKFALKHTDMVLPYSNFNKKELLERAKPKHLKVVYFGFDFEKFKPSGEKEDNLVITVGGINWSNLKRKGIETFVKSAKFIPEGRFVVIGKFMDDSIDYLKTIASANVEFTGFISDKELIKWYQKAKVYVQPSRHEGFGCSVAEAMLCECIPVVSICGALPEVIGECGFTVPYGDEKATAEAIKKALNKSSDLQKKARKRIKKKFPLGKREKALYETIVNLVK